MTDPFALTTPPGAFRSWFFQIPRGKSILGRSSHCDFVVQDESISRKHAEVWADESGVSVTDLRSRNGTFLEGVAIRQSRVIPGSQLHFGKVCLLLQGCSPGDAQIDSELSTPGVELPSDLTASPAHLLSRAQRRVLLLLKDGLAEEEIASRLHVIPHTIHTHVGAIYRAFDVHSHAELLATLLNERSADGTILTRRSGTEAQPRNVGTPSLRTISDTHPSRHR